MSEPTKILHFKSEAERLTEQDAIGLVTAFHNLSERADATIDDLAKLRRIALIIRDGLGTWLKSNPELVVLAAGRKAP